MCEYSSPETKELAKALMDVQRQLQPVVRDAVNDYIGNRYATLKTVMDSCRPLLLEHDVWMVQYPVPAPSIAGAGALGLVTKLTHIASGQWQSSLAVAPLPKADPQGYGSCLSYLRRYTLCAMLGIVTEDDDGEGTKQALKTDPPRRKPVNAAPAAKVLQGDPSQGETQKRSLKPLSASLPDLAPLPKIDGIAYQSAVGQDGRAFAIATGDTRAKKALLAGAGFKWSEQRQVWWRYADVS